MYDTESLSYTEAQVEASICRASFADFAKCFWETVKGAGTLEWNWHMDVLCEELQTAAERVFKGLPREYDIGFNVPPGTSKSTIISILFPAWVWTRMPQARFLSATHTDKLALDLSSKCRGVITSEKYEAYYPTIDLIKDTEGYFRNNFGGDRNTCTVGGKTPTGFHASFILVDDPVDPEGVRSDADLDAADRFMTNVLPGRKTNKAVSVIILVMQRLHWRDPTYVMEESAKKSGAFPFRKICLPGKLTPGVFPPIEELRTRYPQAYNNDGAFLDPGRLGKLVMQDYLSKGAYFFNPQILQNPEAPGGNLFEREWWHYERMAPYECIRIRAWDRACLVAGTMVETISGPKPIEQIVAGDMVLTRKGYKRVKWAGMTKRASELVSVKFSNEAILTGTGDHPVWTENGGWIELATLNGGCYNIAIAQNSYGNEQWQNTSTKLSRSMESFTREWSEDVTTSFRGGAKREGRVGVTRCTELSGVSTTVVFPKVMSFITRTRTGITTRSEILNVSQKSSICRSIVLKCIEHMNRGRIQEKDLISGLMRIEGLQNLSDSVKFVQQQCGQQQRDTKQSVVSVERNLRAKREQQRSQNTAHQSAGICIARECGASARYVANYSEAAMEEFAALRAVLQECTTVPVYDLTVEGEHEFFANGILVHNSTEDGGCYTAGVLISMALDRSKFFVEDCVHGQWSSTKRNEKILATAQRDRLKYGPKYEPTIIIEGERGSTGEEAYQYLASMLAGFRVFEELPTGTKDSRAEPWASQVKAGNVYVIDGGASSNTGKPTWDVEGYLTEHSRFRPDPNVKRLGKYKDQVDASALAFIKLVQGGAVSAEEVVKVFTFVKKKSETQLRIVVTNDEILSKLVIDDNETIMISLQDPLPVGSKKTPLHALSKLQETLLLHFVDLQPSERLDQWDEPLLPYGVLAEDLIFTRDMGKRLWNFLFKKRSPAPGVVVIHGNGRKALSVAIAITDTMRLPRSIIYRPDNPDFVVKEPAENDHVYQLVKNSRQWVSS